MLIEHLTLEEIVVVHIDLYVGLHKGKLVLQLETPPHFSDLPAVPSDFITHDDFDQEALQPQDCPNREQLVSHFFAQLKVSVFYHTPRRFDQTNLVQEAFRHQTLNVLLDT